MYIGAREKDHIGVGTQADKQMNEHGLSVLRLRGTSDKSHKTHNGAQPPGTASTIVILPQTRRPQLWGNY